MTREMFARVAVVALMTGGLTLTTGAWADDDDDRSTNGFFEVTGTNVARGQQFTPILVASHRADVRLFELGKPASPELQIVAEEATSRR